MADLDSSQLDELLQTLTGVVRARVRASDNGPGLSEIHILSDGALAPKQIVRNIETLLKTAFDLTIDHRIVSIAVLKEGAEMARTDGPVDAPPAPASRSTPRVVFQRLRVIQEPSLKATAHVELRLGDVIFEGSHRDTDTPKARMYASARAVIEALDYLAEKEMAFYLAGLELLQVFNHEVMVVLVEGRHHLDQVRMLGTAIIRDDPHEAAVRAVLDAVNRFIHRPDRRSLTTAR